MIGPMDGIGAVVLVAALIAAAIVMLLMAQISHARDTRQLRRRISGVQGRVAAREENVSVGSVRAEQAGRYPGLEAIAKKFIPRPALLRERLDQTGLKIDIGQYVLICLGVGLSFTLVRSLVFHMPPTLAILLGLVSGLGLPHIADRVSDLAAGEAVSVRLSRSDRPDNPRTEVRIAGA